MIQTKTINDYDGIIEQIPKNLLFDTFESFPYKILKYTPLCHENINSGAINITFQIYSDPFMRISLYKYDSIFKFYSNENRLK